MAKHNCAICGAEIGLMSEQKLADGNYICRKVCCKKTMDLFDKVHATLGDVTAHIAQVEKGTQIWNELLKPMKDRSKEVKLTKFGTGYTLLYISPSTGLAALVETRKKYGIFGKEDYACVFRLADLCRYDYAVEEDLKGPDGRTEKKHFCLMTFRNTEGMYTFRLPLMSEAGYREIEKYINKLFGIQKTLKNAVNNSKRQINAIKSAVGAMKAAKDGTLDCEQATSAIGAMNDYVCGDRTEWISKADAALAKFNSDTTSN